MGLARDGLVEVSRIHLGIGTQRHVFVYSHNLIVIALDVVHKRAQLLVLVARCHIKIVAKYIAHTGRGNAELYHAARC